MNELYRHWDESGALLYVGVSLSAVARLREHRQYASWYSRIVTVTIERFATRNEMMDAEREAIRQERPAFNTMHSLVHEGRDGPTPFLRVEKMIARPVRVPRRICGHPKIELENGSWSGGRRQLYAVCTSCVHMTRVSSEIFHRNDGDPELCWVEAGAFRCCDGKREAVDIEL